MYYIYLHFRGKRQAARDIAGRCPVNHHWDAEEPKLLICEAQIQTQPSDQREKEKEDWRWGGGEDDHRSISLTKATMDTTVSQHHKLSSKNFLQYCLAKSYSILLIC